MSEDEDDEPIIPQKEPIKVEKRDDSELSSSESDVPDNHDKKTNFAVSETILNRDDSDSKQAKPQLFEDDSTENSETGGTDFISELASKLGARPKVPSQKQTQVSQENQPQVPSQNQTLESKENQHKGSREATASARIKAKSDGASMQKSVIGSRSQKSLFDSDSDDDDLFAAKSPSMEQPKPTTVMQAIPETLPSTKKSIFDDLSQDEEEEEDEIEIAPQKKVVQSKPPKSLFEDSSDDEMDNLFAKRDHIKPTLKTSLISNSPGETSKPQISKYFSEEELPKNVVVKTDKLKDHKEQNLTKAGESIANKNVLLQNSSDDEMDNDQLAKKEGDLIKPTVVKKTSLFSNILVESLKPQIKSSRTEAANSEVKQGDTLLPKASILKSGVLHAQHDGNPEEIVKLGNGKKALLEDSSDEETIIPKKEESGINSPKASMFGIESPSENSNALRVQNDEKSAKAGNSVVKKEALFAEGGENELSSGSPLSKDEKVASMLQIALEGHQTAFSKEGDDDLDGGNFLSKKAKKFIETIKAKPKSNISAQSIKDEERSNISSEAGGNEIFVEAFKVNSDEMSNHLEGNDLPFSADLLVSATKNRAQLGGIKRRPPTRSKLREMKEEIEVTFDEDVADDDSEEKSEIKVTQLTNNPMLINELKFKIKSNESSPDRRKVQVDSNEPSAKEEIMSNDVPNDAKIAVSNEKIDTAKGKPEALSKLGGEKTKHLLFDEDSDDDDDDLFGGPPPMPDEIKAKNRNSTLFGELSSSSDDDLFSSSTLPKANQQAKKSSSAISRIHLFDSSDSDEEDLFGLSGKANQSK